MELENDLDPNTPPPSVGKRMIVMILGVLGLALVIALIWFAAISKRMAAQPKGEPPQTVTTATASYATWQPSLSAVGTLRAAKGADLAIHSFFFFFASFSVCRSCQSDSTITCSRSKRNGSRPFGSMTIEP